jgi:REP element-mobilizing transposase RayT
MIGRNKRDVVYRLHAHVVLAPKYRKELIMQQVTNDLRS